MSLSDRPYALDVILSLLCFLAPPGAVLTYLIGREWRRLRRSRDLDRLEAERMRTEGFPPPGPPTA